MPGPKISNCGHPGEPACPPQDAFVHLEDGTKIPVKVHKANGHHFIEVIKEELNRAAGEAFGNRQ